MKIPGLSEIIDKDYFHGLLPREDLPDLLKKEGDFLVRVTEPAKGDPQCMVISVMADESCKNFRGLKHYVIAFENGKFHLGGKTTFNSITDLIHGSKKDHKFVNGVHRKSWELTHSEVKIMEKLGEGAYGEVSKGMVAGTPVAIKQNHMNKLNKAQIKEIMFEARNMRKLRHPHIVRLVGIAALEQPLLIVMELASDGSLDNYLKKNGDKIDEMAKTVMCQQISWALVFLQEKSILHRDLAARNCLYDKGSIKISDFGKCQPGPSYKMDPTERLPIRWLSPETMVKFVYDYASEVWSFGICCYEIYNNGVEPYTGKTVREVYDTVTVARKYARIPDTINKFIRTLLNEKILVDVSARQDIHYITKELEKYTKVQATLKSGTKSEIIKKIKSERLSKNSKRSERVITTKNGKPNFY